MTTINRIPMTVTGNTSEISYRTSRNGTTFASFSVCQQARIQDQDGKWKDGAATWIRVTAAGPLAEHMRDSHMVKGVRVTVTGWYQQRDYQDEKGQRRSIFELHASDVAASLQYATVQITKPATAHGFAGSQPQTAGMGGGYPTQTGYGQPSYTDGFADANPQTPQI